MENVGFIQSLNICSFSRLCKSTYLNQLVSNQDFSFLSKRVKRNIIGLSLTRDYSEVTACHRSNGFNHTDTTMKQNVLENISSIVIIPDHALLLKKERAWYNWLADTLRKTDWSVTIAEDFPSPYESNTKRWESVWLGMLMNDRFPGSSNSLEGIEKTSLVVAHGTGADAVLRMLEKREIVSVILIGPTSEYHAGERHGRAYHYEDVKANCAHISLLYSDNDPFVSMDEFSYIEKKLDIQGQLLPGRRRYMDPEFPELLQVVQSIIRRSKTVKKNNIDKSIRRD